MIWFLLLILSHPWWALNIYSYLIYSLSAFAADFLRLILFYFIFSLLRFIPHSDAVMYSSIVANHIFIFRSLIGSLNYSSCFASLLAIAIASTTILVTKMLIINLYHIIIPLTAPHKMRIHILTASSLSVFLLFPFLHGSVALARLTSNATWITKTKTQTENKAWGKIHSTARSGAEIASATQEGTFQFSNAAFPLSALSPAFSPARSKQDSDLNGGCTVSPTAENAQTCPFNKRLGRRCRKEANV